MNSRARAVFFRSFAVMFRAGVPLTACFDMLSLQQEDPEACLVAEGLARGVRQGKSLVRVMGEYPDSFSRMHIRLIDSGVRSGSLDHSLASLAEYEEKRRELLMKLRSTLTYPLLIVGLTGIILLWLPSFAMSGIFELLESYDTPLPLLTRLFALWSDLLGSPLFYLIAGVVAYAAVKSSRKAWARKSVRFQVYTLAQKTPVLGNLLRALVTARFAHTLSLQLKQGMPILPSLQLAAETTGSEPAEKETQAIIEKIKEGSTLADVLRDSEAFHPYLAELAAAGEESGKLPLMLSSLATLLESEVEHFVTILVNLLEPLVLAAMGVFVGLFVLATAMPIVQLLRTL